MALAAKGVEQVLIVARKTVADATPSLASRSPRSFGCGTLEPSRSRNRDRDAGASASLDQHQAVHEFPGAC